MTIHGKALLISALLLSAVCSLNAADVSGRWNAEFETQIGHLKYIYDLKVDGEKISGKASRDRDGEKTEIEIKEGKLSGNDVSFVELVKIQDQDVRIEYKGVVSGDEIKFTRKVGDFATMEIVAKREKAAAASIAGKWQAEFETQIGKQKYIYEFKVDGEKLTGRASGGGGEINGGPFKSDTGIQEGKISGADVSFVEMIKVQDMEIRVQYNGTIKGDEIRLTRKVGEIATEELVAKRIK